MLEVEQCVVKVGFQTHEAAGLLPLLCISLVFYWMTSISIKITLFVYLFSYLLFPY